MNTMNTCGREDSIRNVRYIGESIIKNAESIVGTEEYVRRIKIQAFIERGSIPYIEVSKEFFPERAVKE